METLLWFVLLSTSAYASPAVTIPIEIPPCQRLLIEQREQLAWTEMDKFRNLRFRYPEVLRTTLGLLLAVHESRLDGEPVGIGEARSFVPANAKVAQTWIDRAADQGLLILGRGRSNRKFRTVEAGPALPGVVNARIDAHLADLLEDARALLPARRRDLSHPPPIRSRNLDRLLMGQMWTDYAHAWGMSGSDPSPSVRTAYGLLVHLYHLNLYGRCPSRTETLPRVPGRTLESRQLFLRGLSDRGWIESRSAVPGRPVLCPTAATIDLVERRMNANVERMNRVLREATGWGPVRSHVPTAAN